VISLNSFLIQNSKLARKVKVIVICRQSEPSCNWRL